MMSVRARKGTSRAKEKMNPTNLKPNPVRDTDPTTIPAAAQAMQIRGMFFAPM
ncbi:MAG: hypothetical protein BWY88_00378 [Synergistetes bacterium ADurb.Bin520]|nr:MAG: hypothetical protein BWY88_00378 [Synergistetes bacterium ADurb.Bin520]